MSRSISRNKYQLLDHDGNEGDRDAVLRHVTDPLQDKCRVVLRVLAMQTCTRAELSGNMRKNYFIHLGDNTDL